MNFFIDKKDIINVLSDFSVILKENSVRPVLSGIFIQAENNKLTFTATNLEIDLIKSISAKIITPGSVVIRPALILEYIKLLNIDEIEFNLEDDLLTIHSAEFLVLSSDNYPRLKKHQGINITDFNSSNLRKNIDKVRFAASVNADNIAISVIRINIKKDQIHYVATDSFRLIYHKEICSNFIEKSLSIPLESMNSLTKILSDTEESKISLYTHENYAIFTWDDTYFATRIVELNYPDYEAILNNSHYSKIMEFNEAQLESALKKVISISRTNSDLKFGAIFDFKNKKLEIKTSSGKAKLTEKLDMIKEGEDFIVSLNAKFMYDFVSAAKTNGNIIIRGNNSHAMFEINERDNTDYRYILMPLAMRS